MPRADGCNVKEAITFFGLAFPALLPLVNPLGGSLLFLGLVGKAPPHVYRALARRIEINTTLFLLVIEGMGTAMLKFFGISLPVMQVAGGLVLAAMGWNLLNEDEPPAKLAEGVPDDASVATLDSQVFYPFTFPITAGPGCIDVMVTLSAHASAQRGFADFAAHAGIVTAVVLLSLTVFVCYGFAPAIAARVRPQTAHGILRVIAFVLLAIGVQITWNGAALLLGALSRGSQPLALSG
jgi:multiple antibiotic resistance protein